MKPPPKPPRTVTPHSPPSPPPAPPKLPISHRVPLRSAFVQGVKSPIGTKSTPGELPAVFVPVPRKR